MPVGVLISTTKLDRRMPQTAQPQKARQAYDQMKENQKVYQKQLRRSTDKVVKRVKKNHHFFAQAAMLFAIGLLVFVGNMRNTNKPSVSYSSGFGGAVLNSSVDEVASVEVAAHIARGANLIVADNVSNLADSLNAKVSVSSSSDSYIEKPQLVSAGINMRTDVIEYITVEGDNVSGLAQKFNITSDTIRWANNLTGEALGEGKKLLILPVSGLLYTVKEGDTPQSLASKFSSSADRIVAFNDAEISGLKVGSQIIIPDGEKPAPTPSYSSSGGSSYSSGGYGYAFGNAPIYGGNGYSYGYCTWYAANRRQQIGKPIPRNFGNAVTWASLASSAGYAVDGNPRTGDVLWHKNTYIAGGYGHVAFVEAVNADGSILVSEMNMQGWNVVSNRTIPPSEFGQYLFIH